MHYVYNDVDESESETMSIYPNPAHDFIFVEENLNLPLQSVEIYNVTGQKVISSTETEINVSGLESGVYFVCVVAEGKTVIQRIVKQ